MSILSLRFSSTTNTNFNKPKTPSSQKPEIFLNSQRRFSDTQLPLKNKNKDNSFQLNTSREDSEEKFRTNDKQKEPHSLYSPKVNRINKSTKLNISNSVDTSESKKIGRESPFEFYQTLHEKKEENLFQLKLNKDHQLQKEGDKPFQYLSYGERFARKVSYNGIILLEPNLYLLPEFIQQQLSVRQQYKSLGVRDIPLQLFQDYMKDSNKQKKKMAKKLQKLIVRDQVLQGIKVVGYDEIKNKIKVPNSAVSTSSNFFIRNQKRNLIKNNALIVKEEISINSKNQTKEGSLLREQNKMNSSTRNCSPSKFTTLITQQDLITKDEVIQSSPSHNAFLLSPRRKKISSTISFSKETQPTTMKSDNDFGYAPEIPQDSQKQQQQHYGVKRRTLRQIYAGKIDERVKREITPQNISIKQLLDSNQVNRAVK